MSLKLTLLGIGLLSVASTAVAALKDNDVHIIIKYKQQTKTLAPLQSHVAHISSLAVKEMKPMANGAYALILKGASSSNLLDTALTRLRKDPDVLYAVEDRVGFFKPLPDPEVNQALSEILSHESQWDEFARPAGVMLESRPGLKDGAWAFTTGKATQPIVVAVLDTGVALNENLINSLLKNTDGSVAGWNFAENSPNLRDDTGGYHGTHVSGTIAGYGAVTNGMGEDLRILTVKIPDASGMFYESAVVNGIYWSVGVDVPGVPVNNYPAKVLNMSFGVDLRPGKEIDYCDEALQEAVFFARSKGAVLVAAAGNDNVWEHYGAPAVCNGTIKVASTGPEGLRSYFSNYGPGITFAAPGGDKHYGLKGGILSTVNPGGGYMASGFDFYQGTSMAAPHVAGVAGLLFAAQRNVNTPEQIEQILYTTTHDFGVSSDENRSCTGKKPCGHGILDAENAVKAVIAEYDALFTAPAGAAIKTRQCAAASLAPAAARVHSGASTWITTQSTCQAAAEYRHPHVEQTSDGSIYAYYGKVKYKLDQTAFRACYVIGYDGVGCYL